MSLLSAFLALVVSLALMAAGSVFLLNETRLSQNAVAVAVASGEDEVQIGRAVETWSAGAAQPLSNELFLVARGHLGLLVHLEPVAFPAAALISAGSVTLDSGVTIQGAIDSGATGSLVGDLDLDRVAAMADVRLPGGRYVPGPPGWAVVHVLGDAEIPGGDGSGLLLVDGSLTIDGPATFRGVIVARGELVVSTSGAAKSQLYGSVVTFVRARGDSSLSVTYSKPIIDSALARFGRPEKLKSRSWIRLF
jgi:hypothetical protein